MYIIHIYIIIISWTLSGSWIPKIVDEDEWAD